MVRYTAEMCILNAVVFPELTDLKANLASRLFEDFTGPGNWELFSDVVPSLEKLQEAGVLLGVISNFDERIGSLVYLLIHTKHTKKTYRQYFVRPWYSEVLRFCASFGEGQVR